jgi:glyoxalase family protein
MIVESPMSPSLLGLHHVTAIAGDPQRNLHFYTAILGLRLVKVTVNFDDPTTYHLYYGDGLGRPGTIVTFFLWPNGRRGRQGTGQVGALALAIPAASLGYWIGRLVQYGVRYDGPARRFDDQVLSFRDPDGLMLELVATQANEVATWEGAPVPAEHAIRGLHSVTLWTDKHAPSARLITETLGFQMTHAEENRLRYSVAGGGSGAIVDVREIGGFWEGVVAVGTTHHVAWRTPDDDQQTAWRDQLVTHGVEPTPVRDRQYFRSIYFREPGGVLFEIATDEPGFAVDESPERLGSRLMLPLWLEAQRAAIETALPTIYVPGDIEVP